MPDLISAQDKSSTASHTKIQTGPDIVPDSVADGIFNTVCKPSFPKGAPNGDYSPALNNDPKANTEAYFKYLRDKKADPAPQ